MLTELICGLKKARNLLSIRRTGGRKLFANGPFYTRLFHPDVISVARRSLSLRVCSIERFKHIQQSSSQRIRGAGARRLVGFCCMFRTYTLAHGRRLVLARYFVGRADRNAISSFHWNRTRLSRQAPGAQRKMPRIRKAPLASQALSIEMIAYDPVRR